MECKLLQAFFSTLDCIMYTKTESTARGPALKGSVTLTSPFTCFLSFAFCHLLFCALVEELSQMRTPQVPVGQFLRKPRRPPPTTTCVCVSFQTLFDFLLK